MNLTKIIPIAIAFIFTTNQLLAQKGLVKRADRLFDRLDYVGAKKKYAKIATQTDTNFHVVSRLADCYRLMRKSEQAVQWYSKAVNLNEASRNPMVFYHYAVVLKETEKYKQSDEWMDKYFQSHSEDKLATNLVNVSNWVEQLKKDSFRVEMNPVSLNTSKAEWGPAYYRENQMIYVSARDSGRIIKKQKYKWNNEPFLDLYLAERKYNGDLINPKPIIGRINTDMHEGPACVSPDKFVIYFTRNNYITRDYQELRMNRLKLYSCTYNADKQKWGRPVALPFNNNDYSCGHPSISKDGTKLYFASDMPGGFGKSDIYVSTLTNGEWGTPVNLGSTINTPEDEMFPFIHPTGTLFYASKGMKGLGGFDTYFAAPQGDSFETPKNMGYPINSSKDDFSLIIDPEKYTGYFASNRSAENDDIFRFEIFPAGPKANNDFVEIVKNQKNILINPLKNDSTTSCKVINLYEFAKTSTAGGSVKRTDENKLIYTPKANFFGTDTISYEICDTMQRKSFSKAKIIVKVNDIKYFIKIIARDVASLKVLDSVNVKLKTSDTKLDRNGITNQRGIVIIPVTEDTDYKLNAQLTDYYNTDIVASSKDAKSDTITVPVFMKMYPYILQASVVYRESNKPVENVKIDLIKPDKQIFTKDSTNAKGFAKIPLEASSTYIVKLVKDAIFTKKVEIKTEGTRPGTIKINEVIEVDKKEIGMKLKLNIYFDLGKSTIRPESKLELDEKALQILDDNPSVTIEIGAHTDSRGSATTNQTLSQARAESVVNYLIEKGVATNRLKAVGYGETRLVNGCKDGVQCNEKQHQENRRVEMEITGY